MFLKLITISLFLGLIGLEIKTLRKIHREPDGMYYMDGTTRMSIIMSLLVLAAVYLFLIFITATDAFITFSSEPISNLEARVEAAEKACGVEK